MKPGLSFLFLALFSVVGCKKNDPAVSLIGSWKQTGLAYSASTMSLEYRFDNSGKLDIARTVYDKDGSLLGYRYLATGSYTANGNTLSIVHEKAYTTNLPYVTFQKLVETPTDHNPVEFDFKINSESQELTLSILNCPPNANCLAQQVFKKSVKLVAPASQLTKTF